jgi:hypothetical protein
MRQELTEVVSGEEGHEVMEVVSEEEGGAGEDKQEGGHAKANDEVEQVQDELPELQCSICLDAVVAGGEERSTASLQCGHEFHLGEQLPCLEISRIHSSLRYVSWRCLQFLCGRSLELLLLVQLELGQKLGRLMWMIFSQTFIYSLGLN